MESLQWFVEIHKNLLSENGSLLRGIGIYSKNTEKNASLCHLYVKDSKTHLRFILHFLTLNTNQRNYKNR